MSESSSEGLNVYRSLALLGSGLGTFVLLAALIAVYTGTPVLAGFFLGLDNAIFWLALVGGLIWFGYRADDFSTGFVLLTIGLVVIVTPVLPGWLTRPFAFISEWAFGTQLSAFDRVEFAVLSVATVITIWAVQIRLSGQRAKTPRGVAGQLENRFKSVATQYRNILASVATIVLILAAGAAGLFGDVAGELVRFLAQAPVMSGFGAAVAGYYYNHIAGIPIIGSVGPWVFFGLLLAVFALVIGVKFNQ